MKLERQELIQSANKDYDVRVQDNMREGIFKQAVLNKAKIKKENTSARKPTKGEKRASKNTLNNLMHIWCRANNICIEMGEVDSCLASQVEDIKTKVEELREYVNNAMKDGIWEQFVEY